MIVVTWVHWHGLLCQTMYIGCFNWVSLAFVMKSFKAKSAQQVNHYLQRSGALWQKAYYDHALRKEEDIRAVARYIVANPLRAGLVDKLGNYPLWDAIWL